MTDDEKVEEAIDFLERLDYPLETWQATALRRVLGADPDAQFEVRRNGFGRPIHIVKAPDSLFIDKRGTIHHNHVEGLPCNDGCRSYT